MCKYFLSALILMNISVTFGQSEVNKTALLLIDIQDFYFPGGKVELVEPQVAAKNAGKLLNAFRANQKPVIHVKHKFEPGGSINQMVWPLNEEKVIEKTEVNAFNGTNLNTYLQKLGVSKLVVVGMQTHMCVEGAVRGAYDLGYKIVLIEDACATKDINYNGQMVLAKQVQASTLATLKSYAEVMTTEDFFKKFPF